jgi:hypothetical protein
MTFTCDPQLILRDEALDDFDKMADDAKQAMRAFNRLLQSAISADAEASEYPQLSNLYPLTTFCRG